LPEGWKLVEGLIGLDWSAEQISDHCRDNQIMRISPEWIYQSIYQDKRDGGSLWKHLRCRKKRKKRYGSYEKRGQIHGWMHARSLRQTEAGWETGKRI